MTVMEDPRRPAGGDIIAVIISLTVPLFGLTPDRKWSNVRSHLPRPMMSSWRRVVFADLNFHSSLYNPGISATELNTRPEIVLAAFDLTSAARSRFYLPTHTHTHTRRVHIKANCEFILLYIESSCSLCLQARVPSDFMSFLLCITEHHLLHRRRRTEFV